MAIKTYSISELATEILVTTRTLRFYEEKGLLKPKRQGQARIYSAADRVRLKLILRGKRLGFSLDESESIINLYEPGTGNRRQLDKLINKIHEKRAQLEAQRRDIDGMLEDLRASEDKCLAAMNEGDKPTNKSSSKNR